MLSVLCSVLFFFFFKTSEDYADDRGIVGHTEVSTLTEFREYITAQTGDDFLKYTP